MKTDTLFYKIFLTFPQLVFQLIDRPFVPGYRFSSTEVKEKGFRFDGVFLPPMEATEEPIYFIEVQFQYNPNFYWAFLSEVFLYLNQQKPQQDWVVVAIFPDRNTDVTNLSIAQQEMVNSRRIVRIYLDELPDRSSVELKMIKLITCHQEEAIEVVNQIRSGLSDERIIEFVGDILFYKFPKLSRKEIEVMFALEDLRQTKVFQEAREEGIQLGKQEGREEGIQLGKQEGELSAKLSIAAQLLNRLSKDEISSITGLTIAEIDRLENNDRPIPNPD